MGRRGHHTYEQLQQMIIDAAFDLLREHGVANVSTRKIAKQIGYTVGTLYIIFKNQEELYLYINSRTIDLFCEHLNNDLANCPKESILKQMALSYYAFATNNFNLWQMLFEYTFSKECEMPQWYVKKIHQIDELIIKYFKILYPELDDAQLMLKISTFSAAVHGLVSLDIRGKLNRAGFSPAEDVINNLATIFNTPLHLVK